MIEPSSAQDLFKGRHFDQAVIILCVRWYLTFKLSSRDLVQMMAERGVALAHTTILRWVQRYVPDFEKRWSRYALPVGDVIDLKAESARLEKEIKKLDDEIRKIDAKLGNAAFVSRAPEEVVEEQRERRQQAEATKARLTAALQRLKA